MTGVRVGICDDDQLQRAGIASYVDRDPGLTLVGGWPSGNHLLANLATARLDIALLDVRMPTFSGPDTARALSRTAPSVKVLYLTSYPGELTLDHATPNVMGALTKDLPPEIITNAIHGAAAGVTQIAAPFRPQDRPDPLTARIATLARTERDEELLRLLAAGASNRDIARALIVSESTVKQALQALMTRARVDNRVALILHLHALPTSQRH